MHLQTLLDGGALRLVRRREHVLHRRAADRDLRAPALQVRGRARLHQQAAVRPQARTRHAAAALRPGGAARQDRRAARARSGRAAAQDRREAGLADRELAAHRHDRARRVHPTRSSSGRTGRRSSGKLPARPRRSASRAARTSAAPGCRSTGTRCRSRACSCSLDRSGQVTVFCGATEIGQGSDDVLAAIVAEVLGIDAVRRAARHRRHRPHAGRPRLVLEPRHRHDGQRRDPGRRARAGAASRTPRRRSSKCRRSAIVFAGGRVFDSPTIRRRAWTSREAVELAEAKYGTLGAVGSYTPPRPPARYKGGGVGPSPAYSLHRVRRRGRGRRADRLDHGAEDLDRARHRPRDQPGARARAGRGQRLHGARRGADGGAGVPPAAAEALERARAQDPVDARVQEPHLARHAGGRSPSSSRIPTRTARSARRRSGRARCCR